jgi:hypothetical protein
MTTEKQIQFCKHFIYLWDLNVKWESTMKDCAPMESLVAIWNIFCEEHGYANISASELLTDLLEQLENIDLIESINDHPKKIVGDGQKPNRWFVTFSPNFMKEVEGCWEYEQFEGTTESDYTTYGPFSSLEQAEVCFDNIELDADTKIGSKCIEDRMTGVVKELNLYQQPAKVTYIEY